MNLPSLNYLFNHAYESLKRFPLVLVTAVVGVSMAIYMTEHESTITNMLPFVNILLTAGIGIPVFFSAAIYSEKNGYSLSKKWLLQGIAVIVLFLIWLSLPGEDSTFNTSVPYIRYALYNITAHLITAFIPYFIHDNPNGFWNYNKMLFLRFVTSAIFSAALFLGLVLAISSLELLFDLKFNGTIFANTWYICVGVFNTWFFLSGIPKQFSELEELTVYPKGLRIFAQYILLSLLTVYLLILYTYSGKVLITWDWPSGMASYLILGVSVLGVLTFLLLHPYGKSEESSWIRPATRWYYFILVPLLVVLYLAIGMRISDYGITVSRYAIVALAVWLTIQCGYAAFGFTNIRFVPMSLAAIAILISFGPLGIFQVSERSQVNRLERILTDAGILSDGKIKNELIWTNESIPDWIADDAFKNEGISDSIHNEIKSILDYLDDNHGFSGIHKWYAQDLNSINQKRISKRPRGSSNEAELYMQTLGLKYRYKAKYTLDEDHELRFTNEHKDAPYKVKGYDYMIDFSHSRYDDKSLIKSFMLDSVNYSLYYFNTPHLRFMVVGNGRKLAFEVAPALRKTYEELGKKSAIIASEDELRFKGKMVDKEFELQFHQINVNDDRDTLKLNYAEGLLLLRPLR